MRAFFVLSTAFLFLVLAPAATQAAETVDVPARGTHTRILLDGPNNPKAVVALFAGGQGVLGLREDGRIRILRGNFALRTADLLHARDIATAIVDAPDDMQDDLRRHRGSAEFTQSIAAVFKYLREKYKVPVWAHGTSRGTTSVVAAVSNTKDPAARPDGIILSSSMLGDSGRGYYVFDFSLEKITGPVLIAHHRSDQCRYTSPDDVPKLEKALSAAGPVKTSFYEGGDEPRSDPCQARHYHGFLGIEDKVLSDMADFILGKR